MSYSRPSDFERFVLKEDAQSVSVNSSDACRAAALSMVSQAARSVLIVSRQLDPQVYDDGEFCEAITQLVVGTPRARVRALLRHVDPAVKRSHRLVALAQRLSSFIELRVPSREFDEYNAAFLVVDGAGLIHRRLSDRFEASVNFNDPRMAQELSRQFEEMWQSAVPDINLRRSHL